MKIAHISDLHFSKISFSPFQFFSKRWLGNLNLLFFRRHEHDLQRLLSLAALLEESGVSHVFITGDLTTTSSKKEFEKARAFLSVLKERGMQVFAIPGNHDHYTKKAYLERLFYNYFDSSFDKHTFNLRDHGITAAPLKEGWWLVALDTAIATSLHLSIGHFSELQEKRLQETLHAIPKDQKIILINHFPFFQSDLPRKRLERGDALLRLLEKHPQVKLYLHGHTHRHSIADLRKNHLPLILDCGSTTEKIEGGWHLIDLQEKGFEIKRYKYGRNGWTIAKELTLV
jgi:3',5'-cyclic AMP phosphodiesterase CpdA